MYIILIMSPWPSLPWDSSLKWYRLFFIFLTTTGSQKRISRTDLYRPKLTSNDSKLHHVTQVENLSLTHTHTHTHRAQRDFLTQELERRERLVHTFAHVHKIGVPPLPFSESGSSPNVCFGGVSCVWNSCKKKFGRTILLCCWVFDVKLSVFVRFLS